MTRRGIAAVIAATYALALGPTAVPPSAAAPAKSIWGPVEQHGASQFPIYEDLDIDIFQMTVSWAGVAPSKPQDPRDPSDPAYQWPEDVDQAVAEARTRGMTVSILLTGAPPWANGGRSAEWAPRRPRAFAQFAAAASRRYPTVRRWMIWGEPSNASRFQPLAKATGRRLNARQRRGPRLYARILDAAYASLKRINRRNEVIGGNTWTAGEVVPLNFIRAMRLPSGRRPRMDRYGHNPFTLRMPDLNKEPIAYGTADYSDLDTLARWLDRNGYRDSRGRRLRLFLSELTIPTDHRNHEFNFWVTWKTQARWLTAALRIARRWERIHTIGYLGLYDDQPRPDGLQVNRGLITLSGVRKPAYYAFRRG